ncbi:MAG: M28 family peptidase [Halioglobus sp.]
MLKLLGAVMLASTLGAGVGLVLAEEESVPENKQALATSPRALVEMLSDVAFLPPTEYLAKIQKEQGEHAFPIGLKQLPQYLELEDDPRRDIKSAELAEYAEVLAGIAKRSRSDGEILWGRIQGTKYEREAHQWIFDQLQSFGLEDVHHDAFPSQYPQWRPTTCDLVVTNAPSFESGQQFQFQRPITAFVSATTPPGGIEAPMIYVGDGTAAELQGRNLSGKIVLLRGRTQPSALLNSARTAYSRLATGDYGKPAGVVVWWDVPNAEQVAGRVGAPGGGDDIGKALPWTTIGNDDGLYLRKLLDRATTDSPVIVRLEVQGQMESGDQRISGNTYAILPGRSGDYIVIPTHVDGYFYGIHDNGSSVALNLALARHYATIPLEKREHGIIFLFQGDHEVPGVGGTLPFIDRYRDQMEHDLLLVLRPEHLGMIRPMDEGMLVARSNIVDPLMLLVTNRSPLLIEIFMNAAAKYGIAMGDLVYIDPAADEAAFHPPYNDLDAISSGWIQTGKFYHSTADVDWGGVDFDQMEKLARAHAYVIDELSSYTKKDLQQGGMPVPEKSIYQSDLLKILMGNN